ncbi:hypothetical protein KDL01_16310 [Actinospica durhamensis]|uniref:Uncharacterized protein n=1 Tax=Actinospica durhamensis TaxID=1508375 RepID=A0A941IR27_9ACTN|nr:hypothetical protein [Actinospica durhamensis]MBR7834837.1 hypothetical protein [Actinospica durhamensis]
MTLVAKYEISVPPDQPASDLRAPGTGHFIVSVTNRVQHDGTPIYADRGRLKVAVKEVDGFPTAVDGRSSGAPGLAFPRTLYPLSTTPVERERARCVGGREDGRCFSHVLGQELLTIEALDGSDSSTYRRTGRAEADGALIFEHMGA